MRIPGTEIQESERPLFGGSATYTRLPALAATPYTEIARGISETPAPAAAHIVRPGENLTRIVREFMTAEGRNPSNREVYTAVRRVAAHNGVTNPDLIHPGQSLDLSAARDLGDRPGSDAFSRLPVPAPISPGPAADQSTPVPRRALLEAETLPAPGVPSGESAVPATPVDVLLDGDPVSEPIRISASAVSALLSAPSMDMDHAPHAVGAHAVGGPGAMPSEAALALQRILNSTSNALNVLRGLMHHESESSSDVTDTGPWATIVNGKARLSSEYGMRKDPFSGRMEFHDGIDLAVKRGTEITAVQPGTVVFSGWKGGYGNTVVIRHEDGVESVYGHTARNHVLAGDSIAAGTHIADAGSTGRSTGPHVHFEVRQHGRAVNPLPYLEMPRPQIARQGATP